MAALIRQATRVARQNVLFNFVGARSMASIPPSKAPSEIPEKEEGELKQPPYTYSDKEVGVNVNAFYDELDRRSSKQGTEGGNPLFDEMQRSSKGKPWDESGASMMDIALGTVAGDHRIEIKEELLGNQDPFDVGFMKQARDTGKYDTPIIVPTADGTRLVGCVCEEDNSDVVWMMIHGGEKKTCNCGIWFQAVTIPGSTLH